MDLSGMPSLQTFDSVCHRNPRLAAFTFGDLLQVFFRDLLTDITSFALGLVSSGWRLVASFSSCFVYPV